MQIGSDGFPIHVWQSSQYGLSAVHCTSVDCSSFDPPVVFSLPNNLAYYAEQRQVGLKIGGDGLPVFSYISFLGSNSNPDVNVVHCSTPSCSSYNVVQVTNSGDVRMADIAIGSTGLPVLFIGTAGTLETIACNNADCSSTDPRQVKDSGLGLPISIAAITVRYLSFLLFSQFFFFHREMMDFLLLLMDRVEHQSKRFIVWILNVPARILFLVLLHIMPLVPSSPFLLESSPILLFLSVDVLPLNVQILNAMQLILPSISPMIIADMLTTWQLVRKKKNKIIILTFL